MNHVGKTISALLLMTATASMAVTPGELAARRGRVAEAIGPDSLLLLFSPAAPRRAGDTDYPFRQEDTLYYLTGVDEPDTTLVMIPGAGSFSELLFARRPDPLNEVWNGKMPTFEELARDSGIERIEEAGQFDSLLAAALGNRAWGESDLYRYYRPPAMPAFSRAVQEGRAAVWLLLGERTADGPGGPELRLAAELRQRYPEITIRDVTPVVEALREIKSEAEVALLERAIEVTSEAHKAGMRRALTAESEFQVEATIEFTFRDRGGCCPGFPSIVAAGPNATILHYNTNQDPLPRDGLLLVDIGAEVQHYTADITRTYPISGTFSEPQRAIYQIVHDAWSEGLELMRPGGSLKEVHLRATEVIGHGLMELGLISRNTHEQVGLYFFHGIGHPLGLWTHDVFDRTRLLEPGMVATIEPGVYVRGADVRASEVYSELAEEERAAIDVALDRYDGIGVRIEDDVLITDDAPRVLSDALPRTVKEIESYFGSVR